MKLTARTITALALPPGRVDHCVWDDDIAGFGYRMRVGSGGKMLKSWILQYKHAGATRRLLIGSASVLSADQARTEAKKARAKVELGQDPQGDKVERRDKDRHTMRGVIDQYLAAKKSAVRPRTFVEISRYLTDHFKPLHNSPIDTVTRRDVAARLVAIKNKSGAATAGAARNALSAFFVWAMGEGLAEANPVIGTNAPKTNGARERVLSDDELARVWRACDDGSEHSAVVKLLILTGCRRAEVGDLCWSWFGPDSFTIPVEHSKNKREHTLPVLPMMRSILDGVPHMANRDQLFGERSHGFTRWHCKSELDERCGVEGWTLHDLRRTVATRLGDLGAQPHVIEAALNHQSGSKRGVAGTYNRSAYENEVRNALSAWERYIGLITDDSLRAAHQAYLARGDDDARKKARNAFRDAITEGGAKWTKHVALIERGNVVELKTA
jgi:integrase